MSNLRQQLIDAAIRVAERGLNNGTSGNLSVRCVEDGEAGFYITPTSMPYQDLKPDDIVFIRADGTYDGLHHNRRKPSTEWRFHLDIYNANPNAGAVLHAHSRFASSLSCLRRDIPAFHYMIARFGGATIRCAAYATFGTQALSDAALAAMDQRSACLLANHGMLVCGRSLEQALDLGIELEELCEQYWLACCIGNPILLSDAEMAVALDKFATYGQQETTS